LTESSPSQRDATRIAQRFRGLCKRQQVLERKEFALHLVGSNP
jgi:hypothetical protein